MAEVITASGEHHLVLVVRTKDVDLVLDNLNANVRPVTMTRYHWVRVESPANPKFWSTVTVPTEIRTAMLGQ
jgi:predicted transglutaminase-like cysteine proteinase